MSLIDLTDIQLVHLKCNDNAANNIVTNNGTLSIEFSAVNTTTSAMSTGGKINNAFVFDNVDDYVTCDTGNIYSSWNTGTVSVWVKMVAQGYDTIFDVCEKAAGSSFGYLRLIGRNENLGHMSFEYIQQGNPAGTRITVFKIDENWIGEWVHYVIIGGVGGLQIFVNGVNDTSNWTFQLGSTASTGWFSTLGTNTNTMSVGVHMGEVAGPNHFMNGCIDDFRIFDKRLTQPEIDFLYNSGSGTEYSGITPKTIRRFV